MHSPFNYTYRTYGKMRIDKSYREGQPPDHNHIQFTGFKTKAGFFTCNQRFLTTMNACFIFTVI